MPAINPANADLKIVDIKMNERFLMKHPVIEGPSYV
jgi:hypothetical protein